MDRELYYFSGTLGDALIVVSKLYYVFVNSGETPLSVWWVTSNPEMEGLIEDLIAQCYWIKYEGKSVLESTDEEFNYCNNIMLRGLCYVSAAWGHRNRGFIRDYAGKEFQGAFATLFPDFQVVQSFGGFPSGTKVIGIQVNTGKKNRNEKSFSSKFINELIRKRFDLLGCKVLLLGTERPRDLVVPNDNVVDLVGKLSFHEWTSCIKRLDVLVSPEGFPCFYALANRVRVLAFFRDYQIVARISPEWRHYFTGFYVNSRSLWSKFQRRFYLLILNRPPRLNPMSTEQVFSFIHSSISYTEAQMRQHTGRILNES